MTKQKRIPPPAHPDGRLRRRFDKPTKDLAKASAQLLDGGQRPLDAAALRDALRDLHEFWLTTRPPTSASRNQWFRHRGHRWAGAPGLVPYFGPRPDAAARQHARTGS